MWQIEFIYNDNEDHAVRHADTYEELMELLSIIEDDEEITSVIVDRC